MPRPWGGHDTAFVKIMQIGAPPADRGAATTERVADLESLSQDSDLRINIENRKDQLRTRVVTLRPRAPVWPKTVIGAEDHRSDRVHAGLHHGAAAACR